MASLREFLPLNTEKGFILFYPTTPHDLPDRLEFEMYQLYKEWSHLTVTEITPQIIGKGIDRNILLRLLYLFLIEKDYETYYQLMKLVMPTGKDWKNMIEILKYFTFSKFTLLRFEIKVRILSLVGKITGHPLVDGLICGLWRQYRPGRREKENIFLLEKLLEISKKSVDHYIGMLPYLLYVLMRAVREGGLSSHDNFLYKNLNTLIDKLLHERIKESLLPLGMEGLLSLLQISNGREALINWLIKNSILKDHLIINDFSKIKYTTMRILPVIERRINWIFQEINNSCNAEMLSWYLDLLFKDFIIKGDDEEGQVIDLLRYILLKRGLNSVKKNILLKEFIKRIPCLTPSIKMSLVIDSLFFEEYYLLFKGGHDIGVIPFSWYDSIIIEIKQKYPFLESYINFGNRY